MLRKRDVRLAIPSEAYSRKLSHMCLLFSYNSFSALIQISRVCGDKVLFLTVSTLPLLTTVLGSGKKFCRGKRARGILQHLFPRSKRRRRGGEGR